MPSGARLRMYTPVSCWNQLISHLRQHSPALMQTILRTVEDGRWASLMGAGVGVALQVSRLGLLCTNCAQAELCDAQDTQTGRPQTELCMSEQSGKVTGSPGLKLLVMCQPATGREH